ncbi:MAG: T9SS type A sorting domain-containing protein [Carboxylicivirga sp.]|jgi:hypothetical protein|nr:T9SS type A sorting domain-containing protein [Carboxylicivirga sp.]
MRKLLMGLIAVMALSMYSEAQSLEVQYTYDAAGNRIKRKVVEVKLKSADAAKQEDFLPVEDEWGEREVRIYPNPTHGNLKVNIKGGDVDVDYNYTLYNSAGKKVKNGQIISKGDNPIPMESLAPGIYILIIQSEVAQKTYKIIKK